MPYKLTILLGEYMTKVEQLLVALVGMVIETVEEVKPDPCPTNMIYLAFQTNGVPMPVFENVVEAAVRTGKIKRGGNHTLVVR